MTPENNANTIWIIIIFIGFILYIWAIAALITHWNRMPTWSKVVSILTLIFFPIFGTFVTLLLAYASGPSRTIYVRVV